MRKKKSANNKWVTILALVAIIGGGYYWLSSDSVPTDKEHNVNIPDSALTHLTSDLMDSKPSEQDQLDIRDDTINVAHNTDTDVALPTNHGGAKNAYVDEYGNVIYTQPQKSEKIRYTVHSIGRWGYSVKYPLFFTKETYSQNSDGVTFEDGRGLKLVTYGSWNIFNETITELYKKGVLDAASVTYQRLFRKNRSFVKSGYMKDGKIFYLKKAIIGKDDAEVVVTLLFTYPKSYKQQGDAVIEGIFTSFPIIYK